MIFISQRTYLELVQIAEAAQQGQISRDKAEYLSQGSYGLGMMQFQLLHTLHQILEHDIARAVAQVIGETRRSDGEVIVTPAILVEPSSFLPLKRR
jgi:hypothetical protein